MADKILNTGLDALLGDVTEINQQTIKALDLHQIKPRFQDLNICTYLFMIKCIELIWMIVPTL